MTKKDKLAALAALRDAVGLLPAFPDDDEKSEVDAVANAVAELASLWEVTNEKRTVFVVVAMVADREDSAIGDVAEDIASAAVDRAFGAGFPAAWAAAQPGLIGGLTLAEAAAQAETGVIRWMADHEG
jgi:hypothetical protein